MDPRRLSNMTLALSVVVLQLLAQVKRRVARVGVALNALLGWWWADPTAALIMVPIIAAEGLVYLC